MKIKTIEKAIDAKLEEWVASVSDASVKKAIRENAIITGGCIASMLINDEVNDFDVYFRTRESVALVAKYYVGQLGILASGVVVSEEKEDRIEIFISSSGVLQVEADEQKPYSLIYATSNALTLSNKVQIVLRFYGEPSVIHENYDFVHCTNYWTHAEGLVLKEKALASLITKELIYVGSKYPVCSIIRTRKFIKRGFTINAGQYLKMCFQVSQLDLTNIDTLREQLVGVDSAYFDILLSALEKKKEGSSDFVVTSDYLSEIVDKIF